MTDSSQTSVGLVWQAVADSVGAVTYRVYQDSTIITTIAETQFEVIDLIPATEYAFFVSTIDTVQNESALSEPVAVTTEALEIVANDTVAPTTPANLVAINVTATMVDLSWHTATDRTGVSNYNIYQNASVIATIPETNYQVKGLTKGTSYDFTVSASDAAENESAPSEILVVVAEVESDTVPPTVPVNLFANEITQTTVNLSWDPSTDDSGVANYAVFQDGSVIATVAESNFQVTGLSMGISYDFTISAIDTMENESAPSDTLIVTTESEADTTAPTVPENVIANKVTQTTVNLSWDVSTDDSGVAGYTIFQDGSAVATIEELNYQVTGLSAGLSYDFTVSASDVAENESAPSEILVVVAEVESDTVPPTVPMNVVANEVTQTTVDLSWEASSDDSGVAGYTIFQDGSAVATIGETNYQVIGLSAGTSYSFMITAIDTAENKSENSDVLRVATEAEVDSAPPTVPTNLVVNGVTESMVNLSWNASTDDSGVANYTVFQDGSAIATVTETNYQATGLSAGTNYSFSVSATDTMANGSTQSQAVSVVTQETQQSEPEKLLVFTKTVEFRHGSIAKGVATLASLGAANNFEVVQTENSADFNTQNLQQYQLVVFLNTTGDVLNPTQQSAFESYIQAGGSYMGVHAATDTEYNWPWYGQLVGAYFNGHPNIQEATVNTIDRNHPSTSHLPTNWVRTDEWYNFRNINPRIIPLLNLDENTYIGGTNGSTHPIAWYHEFDGGRSFYTGGGHADSAYDEPDFRQHLLGGIE